MLKVFRIKLINFITVYRMLHKNRKEEFSYYSDFNEGLFKYIISKQCYFFIKNELVAGLLIVNKKDKEIHYIPVAKNDISLFRLIYTLNNNFILKGYTLSINHKNLNPMLYKKYFSINIFENYKYMYLDTNKIVENTLNKNENLFFRKMLINKEEPLRVMLQNNIFGNSAGRRELTLLEVYNEESRRSFLRDMCFILEVEGKPGGYGQILITNGEYYLVNFGIISEYRNKGYGIYFLSQIIQSCYLSGIEGLNLCVDNNNEPAVKLYKKLGFKECYNKFNIIFR